MKKVTKRLIGMHTYMPKISAHSSAGIFAATSAVKSFRRSIMAIAYWSLWNFYAVDASNAEKIFSPLTQRVPLTDSQNLISLPLSSR
jgi:hypothetical protein